MQKSNSTEIFYFNRDIYFNRDYGYAHRYCNNRDKEGPFKVHKYLNLAIIQKWHSRLSTGIHVLPVIRYNIIIIITYCLFQGTCLTVIGIVGFVMSSFTLYCLIFHVKLPSRQVSTTQIIDIIQYPYNLFIKFII